MMISPEAYYKEYLQGKSQSEILQQISLLMKEIGRLKEVMESDENSLKAILSIFLNLGVFNTLICYAGIALFLGYTAYDVSKVRENYYFYAGQGELLKKASIFSALQLYLDFINLFLYILRILGNRKD